MRRWTREEVERLKILYASDKPFEEIVKAFPGRSPNAIRLKASRLGLKRMRPPAEASPLIVKGGETKRLLVKCGVCGHWMEVEDADRGFILCERCGSPCLLPEADAKPREG